MCKAEYFAVCKRASQLFLDVVKIIYLLWRQRQSFLFVILLKVLDVLYGLRLYVYGEDVLVQTVVHTLQHRVVVSILGSYGEILLYTLNALDTHILGNLNGIGTPRCNHLAARTDEVSVHCLSFHKGCLTVKPTKFLDFFFT